MTLLLTLPLAQQVLAMVASDDERVGANLWLDQSAISNIDASKLWVGTGAYLAATDVGLAPRQKILTHRDGWTTFACISDTHNLHDQFGKGDLEQLPYADVLIHAGDFTNKGTEDEVTEFAQWLAAQPHRHKLVVCGNHDAGSPFAWYLQAPRSGSFKGVPQGKTLLSEYGAVVLDNNTLEIEDTGIRVYGSGWNRATRARGIPEGVDVLVTHEPPLNILDEVSVPHADGSATSHLGDQYLREQIDALTCRPRVHVFGHIHEAAGVDIQAGTIYVNAALPLEGMKARNLGRDVRYFAMRNRTASSVVGAASIERVNAARSPNTDLALA